MSEQTQYPTQVIEAPLKLEHFMHGRPSNACFCVLALAVKDLLPEDYYVAINYAGLNIENRFGEELAKILVPQKLCELMHLFDRIPDFVWFIENKTRIVPNRSTTIFQRTQLFMEYWGIKVQIPAELCKPELVK